jgi:hypothetical protein
VAEEDRSGREVAEAAGASAVLGGVRGEGGEREAQAAREAEERVLVVEHVAEDQDAVALAPQGDVTALWPGTCRTVKPATSSPSASSRSTGWPGPSMTFAKSVLIGADGWRSSMSFVSSTAARSAAWARTGIRSCDATACVAPTWSGCACVTTVRGEPAAAQRLQDPPRVEPRHRVDEHVAVGMLDQVAVDRVRREPGDEADAVRDLAHGQDPRQAARCCEDGRR